MLSVDDKVGINVTKFLEGIVYLLSEIAVIGMYIGGDDLFLPSLSGELPVSEESSTNFTVCAITANNIVSFKSDFAIGSLAGDSSDFVVLFNASDFMRPENFSARVVREMLNEDLTKFVQGQACHGIGIIFDPLH